MVRRFHIFALLAVTAALLAGCSDAPIGVSPYLRGTYWQNAIVTYPYGRGPMVVRYGPPDPTVPYWPN